MMRYVLQQPKPSIITAMTLFLTNRQCNIMLATVTIYSVAAAARALHTALCCGQACR